ncbi:hypothetical protein NY08_3685 [Rhodococcus sp. B7740]|nr:hypothetical protein NY08_3685 [Rhodococcus sp. B7740]
MVAVQSTSVLGSMWMVATAHRRGVCRRPISVDAVRHCLESVGGSGISNL